MKIKALIEIILYVKDMQAQVRFYRDILGLRVTFPKNLENYEAEHWVTLDTGACILALHSGGQLQQGVDAPKIVFEVDHIETTRQYLLEHEVKVGPVRSPAPGVSVADGYDPEGNSFSIEEHT